jgi:hypothetical protein
LRWAGVSDEPDLATAARGSTHAKTPVCDFGSQRPPVQNLLYFRFANSFLEGGRFFDQN